MSNESSMPELKQVLGALIFGSEHPLSVKEMRRCLAGVAEAEGGKLAAFGNIKESELAAALEQLKIETGTAKGGFILSEVAGGMRFHSDPACGKWMKHLLDTGRPNRLSRPALETLAIIAYRQPITRTDIEGVRGVNVDHIMRMLMEMQLVRIVGRSELPGKPFQYGTTQAFLEHFGLRDLDELRGMDPMLLAAREREFKKRPASASSEATEAQPAAGENVETPVAEPVEQENAGNVAAEDNTGTAAAGGPEVSSGENAT